MYEGRKYKSEAVPNYGINFEEKNGKIRYVRKQRSDGAALTQYTDGKIIQHEKVVRIGIWAGRFLLDPFVCYAALTHGGRKIENLLNNYLFNLLPEFQPYSYQTSILISGIANQVDQWKQLLSQDAIKEVAFDAMEYVAGSRAYDINLGLVSSHYVFTLLYLPQMNVHLLKLLYSRIVKSSEMVDYQAFCDNAQQKYQEHLLKTAMSTLQTGPFNETIKQRVAELQKIKPK